MSVDPAHIASVLGAASAGPPEPIQSLWSGYGVIERWPLQGGPVVSVVVKHVTPPAGQGTGHQRKLRSYAVEQAWYRSHAQRCGAECRVAEAHHLASTDTSWLFVLEDLDASGFHERRRYLSDAQLDQCLLWLAAFHATFLGADPDDLWPIGTYWHLGTRPDEYAAMADGPLKDAAHDLDRRLNAARFQTLVHGDAKPANFCFGPKGVAAVDFQYVGRGCGVKDLIYLLRGEDGGQTRRAVEVYFTALRARLPAEVDALALEAEWRALIPVARADYKRFLAGWL